MIRIRYLSLILLAFLDVSQGLIGTWQVQLRDGIRFPSHYENEVKQIKDTVERQWNERVTHKKKHRIVGRKKKKEKKPPPHILLIQLMVADPPRGCEMANLAIIHCSYGRLATGNKC
jgi:hypothetical protein